MEEPKIPTDRHVIQDVDPMYVCGRCAKVWTNKADAYAEAEGGYNAAGVAIVPGLCEPIDNPLELATRIALNLGMAVQDMTDDQAEAAHGRYVYDYVTNARAVNQIDQYLATIHQAIEEKGEVEAAHDAYHTAMRLSDELGKSYTCLSMVAWAFACYRSRYRALAPEPQQ